MDDLFSPKSVRKPYVPTHYLETQGVKHPEGVKDGEDAQVEHVDNVPKF